MVALQTMDTIFYEAQRQGRISFYVTTNGEEAINIASAAALSIDDVIFPQVTYHTIKITLGHVQINNLFVAYSTIAFHDKNLCISYIYSKQ